MQVFEDTRAWGCNVMVEELLLPSMPTCKGSIAKSQYSRMQVDRPSRLPAQAQYAAHKWMLNIRSTGNWPFEKPHLKAKGSAARECLCLPSEESEKIY